MSAQAKRARVALHHGRTSLALHRRKEAAGPNLLLLHELYASSEMWAAEVDAWQGSVWALDFSGHGDSAWREGGIYFPETLAADADAALGKIGSACLAGAGVGAYAALLLAGGRPKEVQATLLLPGAGLAGYGTEPPHDPADGDFTRIAAANRTSADPASAAFDPRVVLAEADARPTNYALSFAQRAGTLLLAEDGTTRPPWWEEVRLKGGASTTTTELSVTLAALHAAGAAA
ncbi:MAG: alpha/beta hydrolase [Deltaproteobacteria bacterium]